MPVMTVAKVLELAAEEIEQRGWCQGAFEEEGRLCLRGAIYKAAGGRARCFGSPLGKEANEFVDDFGRLGVSYSADWNDTPGRTKEEVIAKLRELSALAKEQGR